VEEQLVLHILSVCFLPLVTQHAVRMRRVISAVWSVWLFHFFPKLSYKRRDFGGGKSVIESEVCVLILYTNFFKPFGAGIIFFNFSTPCI